MAVVAGAGITAASVLSAIGIFSNALQFLWGIKQQKDLEEFNKEMAELDIEFIKAQTPKAVERMRDLGEVKLGTIKAVVGHSAATMEGTPTMFKQEQKKIIEEDVAQVEAASEHAIAGLEVITGGKHQAGLPGKPDRPEEGEGSTFLTGYKTLPEKKKYPHFGR